MRPTGNRTSSHFSDKAEIQMGPKAHPLHFMRASKKSLNRGSRSYIGSNGYRRAMSSTELAATSTTRENAGELKPHAASKLILRVIQNLVKLGQLSAPVQKSPYSRLKIPHPQTRV
jgi:hypothetical protein